MNTPPRWIAWCLAGASCLWAGCASTPAPPRSWQSLFNGRDLTGWNVKCQPQDQAKTYWQVDQGAILCDAVGRKNHNYVWLLSDQEFGDFELQLKFQVFRGNTGNSGVQFRSRYDDTAAGGWLDGPQVDIHPPGPMTWRTGLIYDETREEKRWIFPSLKDWRMEPQFEPKQHVFKYADDGDGWNDLVLLCDGLKIKTIVNGVIRTDWDATGVLDNAAHVRHQVGRKGHFALQLHSGDELRIRFKDIHIRSLE